MPRFYCAILLVLLIALPACTSRAAAPGGPGGKTPAGLTISSPAFAADAEIPARFTCNGENISPALVWSAVPDGTKSLALVVEDPDAPAGTFIHWVVYNLPPDSRELAENASKTGLPQGALQGKTSARRSEYGGPCPPGGTHHYHFKLYALDTTVTAEGLDRDALAKAMDGHVLAQGDLVGLYSKK